MQQNLDIDHMLIVLAFFTVWLFCSFLLDKQGQLILNGPEK